MRQPGLYWRVNVTGALNLIEAALAADCRRFIFSSTCATYGDQDGVVLDEDSPQAPINAYGASKRAIEDMLGDFAASDGLEHVIFRYFNVAGADPEGEVGEAHEPETHLIRLMLQAIDGQRPALTVFGSDYPTPDGTCIRVYVHVSDLARAHVQGLDWLEGGRGSRVFCVGSGKGFSVREVIDHARHVTNLSVPLIEGDRRPGDAARLVSGSRRTVEELGWRPERSTLPQMIADAWAWHRGRVLRAWRAAETLPARLIGRGHRPGQIQKAYIRNVAAYLEGIGEGVELRMVAAVTDANRQKLPRIAASKSPRFPSAMMPIFHHGRDGAEGSRQALRRAESSSSAAGFSSCHPHSSGR